MRIYLTEECVHMYTTVRTRCSSLILAVVLSSFFTGAWAQETQEQLNEPILVVNDHVVKRGEFEDFYNFRRRPSSYHDNPLPAELEAARLEALRDLVNRLVLLDEANRRDLKADAEVVENNVQKAGQRYRDQPGWAENKDAMLVSMRKQLEDGDIIRQLETIIRDVADPTEQALLTYFENNPDVFTEPQAEKSFTDSDRC